MKVAVVGSGVSGLAATWLLNEHSDHEVHLYEADDRVGGHANTARFIPPGKEWKDGVDVDTGFIVFNPSTYPNFVRFLKRFPNITILRTEMTFSVSRDGGLFEWAGRGLRSVFCQTARLLDPTMWRLIYDVLRFNACARRLLIADNTPDDISIGEYLHREGYSDSFRDNYLIPMIACIWSTPPDTCTTDFPARALIHFFNNHHLLQITGKSSWLVIKGGSRNYIQAITSSLPEKHLHISTPVQSLSTEEQLPGVQLKTSDGQITIYDHVILACHSDTALSILRAGGGLATDEERILTRFRWNKNEAVLHSDINLMPRRKIAWSCWNFLTSSVVDGKGIRKPNADQASLTYYMNELQHIPEQEYGPVLVTLNPPVSPKENLVLHRYRYDHPVLDANAFRSQREMPTIQGQRHITFAGAWLGYGFHEDGFTSGMRAVADHIDGVRLPFDIHYPDHEPGAVLIAPAFDVFEGTGARVVVGALLGGILSFLRLLLSYWVDLHIEQ